MLKRLEHSPGWYYVSIFGWQPFAFLMHGGWIFLSFAWFKRFIWDVPKQRGWRWG